MSKVSSPNLFLAIQQNGLTLSLDAKRKRGGDRHCILITIGYKKTLHEQQQDKQYIFFMTNLPKQTSWFAHASVLRNSFVSPTIPILAVIPPYFLKLQPTTAGALSGVPFTDLFLYPHAQAPPHKERRQTVRTRTTKQVNTPVELTWLGTCVSVLKRGCFCPCHFGVFFVRSRVCCPPSLAPRHFIAFKNSPYVLILPW